jgi:membrane fusion protein (multidrug efflux system)
MSRQHRIGLLFASACAAVLAVGCSSEGKPGDQAATAPKRPDHLVELADATRETVVHRVERTGTLRALQEAKIFNQEDGAVLEVLVHEGDEVKAGDALVRLDDRLLRAEVAKAAAQRRQAQADLERLEGLKARTLVSEESLQRARTALDVARAEEELLQARLAYMTIVAPFAGKVTARHINEGDVAPRHTHLVTVIDPSSLTTDVTVSELVVARLTRGDAVDVRIDALGGGAVEGRIERIHPTVDPVTRRGRIEVLLDPVPPGASAGQFCRVVLTTQETERLVVPLAALRRDQAGEYVFRFDDGGRVARAPVLSGLRLAERVEVLSGLSGGEKVVVAGFLGLQEGMTVNAVVPGAQADGRAGAGAP